MARNGYFRARYGAGPEFKGMTRYAAYYSDPAELGLKHIDQKATMELFVRTSKH
ncbi:MAG: hypothetical protein LVQ63_04775 [Thermoplasmatales archaeon]|nr:hypothetical protein [Thermoplasmatales archaeon]